MPVKIQLRRDTSSNWSSRNPVLAVGEPGFETDTNKLKLGDGVNPWNDLIYLTPDFINIVSSGGIADLTLSQQDDIVEGTIVLTTDGSRWVYTGSGSKTNTASYIELADISPAWIQITSKPASLVGLADILSSTSGDFILASGNNVYQVVNFAESVDDRVGALSVAGTGININYDDSGNSLTVSVSGIINNPGNNRLLSSRDNSTTGIDAESNLTFDGTTLTVTGDVSANYYFGDLDGAVILDCRNNTASTINKGTPVYISGHFANGKVDVSPADASNSAKMPALGLLGSTLTSGQEGHVHIFGPLSNLDTSAYSDPTDVGKTLYVASGGGLTLTRPTGESVLVQNLARIARIHGSNGRLIVLGPSRTNDVPNSISAYKLDIDNIRIDGDTISNINNNNLTISTTGNILLNSNSILVNGSGVSLSGHTHTSSNITDFNSSVSGLLPTISNSGDNRILTSTGSSTGINAESNFTFDGTSMVVTGDAKVDNLKLDGNTISSTDTNGNIIIQPNNIGALQRDSGGNSRGQYAVDWQTERTGASQVASGSNSIISGGKNNTASGNSSTIGGGSSNSASWYAATIGGVYNNTSSGCNSTVSGGYCNNSSCWGSTVGGGSRNTSSCCNSTVGGGCYNTSSGCNSTVSGGCYNTSSCCNATIGGGYGNTSSGYNSTVGGGCYNTASCCNSTVGGGYCNSASSYFSTVGGGCCNSASTCGSTVSGGSYNCSSGCNSTVSGGCYNCSSGCNATVSGGCCNRACGVGSTVGGGCCNISSGCNSTVSGGYCNSASSYFSTVGGGCYNTSSGCHSTVGGGCYNTASCNLSTVGGGYCNTSCGTGSVVGGGYGNTASCYASTVSGGCCNRACGVGSTVSGGYCNSASSYCSTVSGGSYNSASTCGSTVSGGSYNCSSGCNSTVGGGYCNSASSYNSTVIGGYRGKAANYGEVAHSAGSFNYIGDAQHSILIARLETSDSTANQILYLDGTSQKLIIPAQTSWAFSVKLSAYNNNDNEGAWWIFRGGIRRDASNNTVLIGSLITENGSDSSLSTASASVVADDSSEALEIRVTGVNSKNIRWVAVVDLSQCSYGTP